MRMERLRMRMLRKSIGVSWVVPPGLVLVSQSRGVAIYQFRPPLREVSNKKESEREGGDIPMASP